MAIDIAELDIPVRLKLLEQAKRDLAGLGQQGATVARDIERSFSTANTATATLNTNTAMTTRQFTRLASGASAAAVALNAGRVSVQGLSGALVALGPATGGVGAALAGIGLLTTLILTLGNEAEETENKVRSLADYSEGRLRGIVSGLEIKGRQEVEIAPRTPLNPWGRMGAQGLSADEATLLNQSRRQLEALGRAEREAAARIAERVARLREESREQLTVIPTIESATSVLDRTIAAQTAHAEALRRTSAATAAAELAQKRYNAALNEADLTKEAIGPQTASGGGGLSGQAVAGFISGGGSLGGMIGLISAIGGLSAAAQFALPVIGSLTEALFGSSEAERRRTEAIRQFNDALEDMRFALSGPSALQQELRRITDEFDRLREQARAVRDATWGTEPFGNTQQAFQDRLREIEALEAQAMQQARAAAAAREMADAIEKAVSRIEGLSRTIENLQAFRGGLSLNPQLTILSPMQQLAEARRQYESTVAAAMGGDQNAAGRLPGAAQAFLTASRSVNASGRGYVQDFLRVQNETEAVTKLFQDQKSIQEQMLEELKKIAYETSRWATGGGPGSPGGHPVDPGNPNAGNPGPIIIKKPGQSSAEVEVLQAGFNALIAKSDEQQAELRRLHTAIIAMTN